MISGAAPDNSKLGIIHAMSKKTKTLILSAFILLFVFLAIDVVHNFIRMRHETASNPHAAQMRQQQAVEDAKMQPDTNSTSQKP